MKEQLAHFSKPLHLKVPYAYAFEAKDSAEKLLQRLFYESAEIIERCKH